MKTSTPEQPKAPSPLKILLMGPPGSRKTTLGLQFPDVHVLDCDRNLDGPLQYLKSQKCEPSFTYDDIRVDDSGKERPIEDCYNKVCDTLKLFKSDPTYQKRKTIFLDSLSHVNEFIIRHVLNMKKSKTYEMEARDWSPFKSYAYSLIVARLEEANKTVLASCHEVKIYGKPTAADMMNAPVDAYEPFFQGKVGETLGAFFTDIWRLDIQKVPGGTATMLQTQRTGKVDILKNSCGMPAEIDITKGFSVLEPYLKGRI